MFSRFSRTLLPAALAAALALQPVLAAGQPQVPQGWTSPFSDVSQGQWFYPYVAVLNSQDVIHGYDDGRFGPNDPIAVGASLIMVLKAAGLGEMPPQEGRHWASSYADYALSRGWVSQNQASQLDSTASRLMVARLTAQALGLSPSRAPSPFADTQDPYVIALYERGLIAGYQEGDTLSFHPQDSITRAEVSAIVWQAEEYAGKIHFGSYVLDILPGVPVNSYDSSAFVLEGDRMTYTAPGADTALGIDVSHHQGAIDWKAVAGDGIEFAMIRAAGRYYQSGGVFEDRQFRSNLQGAMEAGLDTGVYFFSQAITPEEAREEARFLLDLLEDFDFDGPVVFDWENIDYDGARTDGMDSAAVTAAALAFCQEVEQAGYQPMIYFNRYIAYLLYDLDQVDQYPFWLAEYGSVPGFYYDFSMWQYTDSGQVAGIQGPVDMNLYLKPQK